MAESSINPATLEFLKKENAKRAKQRKIMMIAAPLLIAAVATGSYFGIKSWRAASQEARANEIVAKAMANGPSPQAFQEVRKAVDSGQITWQQMWQAGRGAWEKAEQERMKGYFNTPAKEREKYLDKIIDDMIKQRQQWEAARAAMGPTTRPNWGGQRERGQDRPTTRPADGERRERGMGGGGRGDSMSPVDRAMNQEFRAAMQRRMEQRGIQMRGRWGGGGGGRGPGGGGR